MTFINRVTTKLRKTTAASNETNFAVKIEGEGCGTSAEIKKLMEQLFTTHKDLKGQIVDLEISQDGEDQTICSFKMRDVSGWHARRDIKDLVEEALSKLNHDDFKVSVGKWNKFG